LNRGFTVVHKLAYACLSLENNLKLQLWPVDTRYSPVNLVIKYWSRPVRVFGLDREFDAGERNNRHRAFQETNMLTNYIRAAMRGAKYEILPDDGTFYGELPELNGVYATADTLEACRDELEEVLEEWLLFRVSKNLPLPVVDGIELTIREVA
jgi:predicted RNase H-like HicB family nuclease